METRRDREPAWVHSQEGSGGAGVRDPCEPVLAEVSSIPPDIFGYVLSLPLTVMVLKPCPLVYRVIIC